MEKKPWNLRAEGTRRFLPNQMPKIFGEEPDFELRFPKKQHTQSQTLRQAFYLFLASILPENENKVSIVNTQELDWGIHHHVDISLA